jgi:hypothetical protein
MLKDCVAMIMHLIKQEFIDECYEAAKEIDEIQYSPSPGSDINPVNYSEIYDALIEESKQLALQLGFNYSFDVNKEPSMIKFDSYEEAQRYAAFLGKDVMRSPDNGATYYKV